MKLTPHPYHFNHKTDGQGQADQDDKTGGKKSHDKIEGIIQGIRQDEQIDTEQKKKNRNQEHNHLEHPPPIFHIHPFYSCCFFTNKQFTVSILKNQIFAHPLIHHTVPPAALHAVVPPCGVWLIRPQSPLLAVLHPAPYGGQGGGATHGPHAKQKLDGGFGIGCFPFGSGYG
ncbi:MAG: hypothetical protein MI862_14865 [Desulfobacterales bacterium]|nr:hypothetical protein [Desulfobacterales bacterium]